MRILMFRHAERENSGTSNPPLSTRGLLQAQKLVQEIEQGLRPRPNKLFSSPKLRAQQTFQQIESFLKMPLLIQPDLDERQNFESFTLFQRRIQKFLHSLESQNGTIYFVSHMDWLEEALRLISSDTDLSEEKFQIWLPGQCIEFDWQDGLWLNPILRSLA
jgi:broad specificity phosphatase PhoE